MPSSKSEDEMSALRSKVAQLEATQKIQHMGMKMQKELMKMQQAMAKRDLETEKKELEMKTTLEKMDAASADERRDRLIENERRDRLAKKKEMMAVLENEKRERLAEKKESIATAALEKKQMMAVIEKHEKEHQHQLEQLKSEVRISLMEQQLLEMRAYTGQGIPISQPTVRPTVTLAVDPAPQRDTELLLQRIQQLEKEKEQLKGTGIQPTLAIPNDNSPAHAHTPDASHQKALQSTAPHKSAVVPHASKTPSQQASLQSSSLQAPKPNEPSAASIAASRSTQQQHQVMAPLLPQGTSKTAQRGPVPLPGDSDNHFFLSHCQSTGGDQTNAIYLELRQLGFACWYDNRADDLTKEGMRQGIVHAAAFLLFLSEGVLDRPFCKYFYMSSSNFHVEFTIHSFSQANLRSERP
jgi:hypothetical protein